MTNGNGKSFPDKEKPLPINGRDSSRSRAGLLCGSFVQLLRQAGLFPVCGVLMDDAFGCGLIDHCGSRRQLFISILRVSGNGGIKLPDGSTHSALHNAVAKIFLLADLYTLLCGLDVRQLSSPPLRILKKPSHEIISRPN